MNLRLLLCVTLLSLASVSAHAQDAIPAQPQAGEAKSSVPQEVGNTVALKKLTPSQEIFIALDAADKTQGIRLLLDEQSAWTQDLGETLKVAALRARDGIFRIKLPVVAAAVFNDRTRCNAFLQAYAGRSLAPHEWMVSTDNLLVVCPVGVAGQFIAPDKGKSNYFESTIGHLYGHCVIRQVAGETQLPYWIEEGLAMTIAAKVVPEDVKLNDYVVKSLFARDNVASLGQLAVLQNRELHGTQIDEGRTDAQQQSFNMVRFLLAQNEPASLSRFLSLPKHADTQNARNQIADRAFAMAFKQGQQAFFMDWERAIRDTLQKPPQDP